ncbi:MAG: ATP-dependent RNA helicase HrpA [Desulfatiglandaceae bacterium]
MTPKADTDIERRISRLQRILHRAMCTDRFACGRSLKRLLRNAGRDGASEKTAKELDKIEARLQASIERKKDRWRSRPAVTFPENLPITDKKEQIVDALRNHQVLIISGETGCGKSTQLPKMCIAAGRGIDGKIGCTQPRRIAAIAVCNRIAEEIGEKSGGSVGYRIRFTDRTNRRSYIKVMTDGILLAEAQRDRMLSEYDTLIVDEAHERSLNIDFLLGMLRKLTSRRPDLKVIITSATMDTEKFSTAFSDAPVITVEGRMFPVELRYRPANHQAVEKEDRTYVDDAVEAVGELLDARRRGDILVFMPTEADILEACERIEGVRRESDMVLPLFARLSAAEQQNVFASGRKRKVIVSTNVAETSLTIPGITYVVDTGVARIPRYLPRTRTTIMPIVPISRSSADQRKGRCGRVRGGVCIRLYSEEDYEGRPRFTPPEIQRANLAEVILRMLSLKLGDIGKFPFIDPPTKRSVADGFQLLGELGAVSGTEGRVLLTARGALMARMPLDPRISRMILEACGQGCLEEIAVIASALSIQDPRERPTGKTAEADRRHSAFVHPESDFLTLFNIFQACDRIVQQTSQNQMRKFCRENYLSYIRIREWRDIFRQITAIVQEQRLTPASSPTNARERYAAIHKSILSGYLTNIAQRKEKNLYRSSRGREVMLFPGSTLFNRGPEWIVAAEVVRTSQLYARTAARIDSAWLEAIGGELCARTYLNPHWEKNRGEVRALEQVSLYGLVINPGRSVSFGKIDPETSRRIFIRALVEGELKPRPPFLNHNLRLVERMLSLEDKLRRRDIFAGESAVENFYDSRLPDICDSRSLAHLIKKRRGDRFLRMKEEDLLVQYPESDELVGFPDALPYGGSTLECTYTFSPGGDQDGVTLALPSGLAATFPASRLEWVVPGLLEEKVTALIKGLPKRYRKTIVPVSRTVKTVLPAIQNQTDQSLVAALARALHEFFEIHIPASVWQEVNIPDHLRMRLSIKDEKGREIAAGRDPSLLAKAAENAPATPVDSSGLVEAKKRWERTDIKRWDFGDLPESVPAGKHGYAYPALVPEEDGPALRLFTDAAEAARVHKEGLKALFRRVMKKDLRYLSGSIKSVSGQKGSPAKRNQPLIPAEAGIQPKGGFIHTSPSFYDAGKTNGFGFSIPKEEIEEGIFNHLLSPLTDASIRTASEFEKRLALARSEFMNRAKTILQETEQVIDSGVQTLEVLAAARRANRSNTAVLTMLEEIQQDLQALVPADFLMRYDTARLESLPRYLKAMQIRAARGSHDVIKDARKKEQVKKYLDALRSQREQLPPEASAEKRNALEDFRWMLEEFKVSLFAQEIKTPQPVSAKRLDRMLKELDRML